MPVQKKFGKANLQFFADQNEDEVYHMLLQKSVAKQIKMKMKIPYAVAKKCGKANLQFFADRNEDEVTICRCKKVWQSRSK